MCHATALAVTVWASSWESKLPSDLRKVMDQAKPADKAEVIVQFRTGPSPNEHRKVEHLGGTHLRTLGVINSGVYVVPFSKLKALASEPVVVRIAPNRGVSTPAPVLADGDQ
ncbi:MAG: hypothetical protein FJW39_03455 [Acidobacteria bacterium]|nr:hypothetical protein [Acidobacteriota bacterium]